MRPLRHGEYLPTVEAMRAFTAARHAATRDEIWLFEHPAVFTLGHAGRDEHLHDVGVIPVVRTERGGQVTYHGPGQIVAYPLIDLQRRRLKLRRFVELMEQAAIDELALAGVQAQRRQGAPGVYIARAGQPKIASVGIKVSHGRSYHGIALNVAMDLEPFSRVDPCGEAGLAVTDLRTELAATAGAAPDTGLDAEIAQRALRFGERIADLIQGTR